MKDKWHVLPKRIGRSRKIQVRQFEPEEIFIEYELVIKDPSSMQDAIEEATRLAVDYLDDEERKLRGIEKIKEEKDDKIEAKLNFDLKITEYGYKLGNFKIKPSEDPQFSNYLHLWLDIDNKEWYIGHLRKNTGEFKFKSKNKEIIQKYGIKKGKHFHIISNKTLNSKET